MNNELVTSFKKLRIQELLKRNNPLMTIEQIDNQLSDYQYHPHVTTEYEYKEPKNTDVQLIAVTVL